MLVILIISALWFIIPAYVANASPVLISKIKTTQRYNRPIDFNLKFRNKPIFGAGKTWFGLFFGILAGTAIGFIQSFSGFLPMTILLAFMLSLGALVGDLAGSFVKRRLGLKRGQLAPGLDQLGFLLGAFLFASFVTKINLIYALILIILTPAIHLGTNFIAFKLRLKKEKW